MSALNSKCYFYVLFCLKIVFVYLLGTDLILASSSTSSDPNDPNKDKSKTPRSKDLHLPISRVRTIMKSTPDIENIGLPSLHVVTKATVIIIVPITLG